MSRDRRTRVVEVTAQCQGCNWAADDAGALGRAAQHHDRTDHEVHTTQTILVIYGTGPTPEELGQTTLLADSDAYIGSHENTA